MYSRPLIAMAATLQPQQSAGRQQRPSIVIESDTNVMNYPGSDVLIHKKDFLIHIKKLSVRSQSSDCASDCRKTDLSSERIVSLTYFRKVSFPIIVK